jgi:hypothetical protein
MVSSGDRSRTQHSLVSGRDAIVSAASSGEGSHADAQLYTSYDVGSANASAREACSAVGRHSNAALTPSLKDWHRKYGDSSEE